MTISKHLTNTPSITMRDPLSQVLGAVTDGLVEYSFLDCVKLVGHSCPTVASTFLMTKLGCIYKVYEPLSIKKTINNTIQSKI